LAFLRGRVTDDNAKWFTLIASCFALFMALLDNLVVNVALPTIQRDLGATTSQLQWIVSAYTLVFASLQITAGGLGDRFGRKRWFMIGIVMFTATSFAAAFVNSIEQLIVVRALQGLGAALIMPLSLSLISAAFPPEERGKAVGIWGAVSVSSIALGPVVGGAIIEYFTWHWIFLVNVPIGILALLVTQAVVRESRDTSGEVATDIPGTVLITAAIASLTWGLIEAGERGWGDSLILTAFGAAAVLGAAFIYVESKTERPMVPLRFFRSSTFTGANIDAFMISFLITGVSFFMTLYQQNIHGFSPIRTGLALLPMVITMMILSPISGSLINRIGPRTLISAGMTVTGVGILLMLLTGTEASYWRVVPSFVVMGLGMSFIWAPMTTAVLNSVEPEKSGIASAVNGAIREIGTAFGVALLGTIANRAYIDHFKSDATVQALRNDPAAAPFKEVIDTIGSGAATAGVAVISQLPADVKAQAAGLFDSLRIASSDAFMVGMDRAVIVSGIGIIVAAAVSYLLVRDDVVLRPYPDPVEVVAAPDKLEPAYAGADAAPHHPDGLHLPEGLHLPKPVFRPEPGLDPTSGD
jgi:EmrB/QacA subfamily drug resistance transporter